MYDDYKAAWTQLTAPGADFEVVTANVRGVDIRTYANAPANLRDVWLSTAAFADRDYLVYENQRLTYAQTHQRVAAMANWLIAQGVKPGDRVAIAMRNYPEWMQAYWATMSVGAAVVGMNAWWIGPEMLYALQDSTPKVMTPSTGQ
jgi:long-chain acyl-CoA synthetase